MAAMKAESLAVRSVANLVVQRVVYLGSQKAGHWAERMAEWKVACLAESLVAATVAQWADR
jgi:hypothetical protein